jgi:hypothetical protein
MPSDESKKARIKRDTKRLALTSKKLEDHEPGASRSEVFQALKKVAISPKSCQKRVEPPDLTSK